MNNKSPIGIDRRIRLEWLEHTVELFDNGFSEPEISKALLNEVSGYLSVGKSTVSRGSGEKAVSNLLKIWIRVPAFLLPLRDAGLKMFSEFPREHHIVLHWGMTIAVYPFWGFVAAQTGRLLKLQKSVTPVQVQRRMKEYYGERPTVKDATRRALRSMGDWGVLKESNQKGVYLPGLLLSISHPHLISWLIEATLHTRPNRSAPLKELIESTTLFPFRITPVTAESLATNSPRLEILRHNLDDVLMILRK